MNSGHALRFRGGKKVIKGEGQAIMADRKPVLPSEEEVAVLRRAARGFIMVTMVDGKKRYTYEDGTPVSFMVSRKDGARNVDRMIKEGWLIPDKGDSLFEESCAPQIYRARKP